MGYKVWGDPWSTADMTGTSKFQTISFPKNTILKAFRTKIIVYNNPTFTNLTAKIYSNEVVSSVNTPRVWIADSTTTHLKSSICSLDNGVKEIWFEFNYVPIRAGEKYNLIINGQDYVYSDASHLAWAKAWPDPVYQDGWTLNFENMMVAPYYIYAIGRVLE